MLAAFRWLEKATKSVANITQDWYAVFGTAISERAANYSALFKA